MSVIPSDIRIYAAFADPSYDGSSTLSAAITTTTATSLTITAFASFPPSGEFIIQIDSEIILVTQGAGTGTWTLIRGLFGSTAATHLINAAVTMPSGGPVSFYSKIAFTDVTASGDTVDYISTSTLDTLPIFVTGGRDTTGVLATETKTLNGQTIVNGSQTWGRVIKGGLGAGTTLTSNPLTSGATSMTVAGFANFPSSGNYYIKMGIELVQVTGGQGTGTWTIVRGVLGTTATAHNSGDNVYLLPQGDVAIVDHTAIVSAHTAQTGSANPTGATPALMKLQSGDGATVAVGQVIRTSSGTGSQQIRTIIATSGYGTDVVAVSRAWGTIPDNTTVYSVYNGMQFDLAPNQIANIHRFLWNASADVPGGSTRNFYMKAFVVNDNTTTAATAPSGFSGVQHQVTTFTPALPSNALAVASTLAMTLSTALNDTVTWATRQTAPGSDYSGFTTQPAAVTQTTNSGNLSPGAAPNAANALGVCFQLVLPAGCNPYNGSDTYQVTSATV